MYKETIEKKYFVEIVCAALKTKEKAALLRIVCFLERQIMLFCTFTTPVIIFTCAVH
jgi:hypothetical protein